MGRSDDVCIDQLPQAGTLDPIHHAEVSIEVDMHRREFYNDSLHRVFQFLEFGLRVCRRA